MGKDNEAIWQSFVKPEELTPAKFLLGKADIAIRTIQVVSLGQHQEAARDAALMFLKSFFEEVQTWK